MYISFIGSVPLICSFASSHAYSNVFLLRCMEFISPTSASRSVGDMIAMLSISETGPSSILSVLLLTDGEEFASFGLPFSKCES
ncbi:hypothetical protein SLA2020_357060 [Shorea laevis]